MYLYLIWKFLYQNLNLFYQISIQFQYCFKISSNTLEYAKNRINSWYKKKDTVQRQTKNKKSVLIYMMIGYL